MKERIRIYIASVLIAIGTGSLAAYFTSSGISSFYATINVPPLSPPSEIFPIVWTILYFLMGISAADIYLDSLPGNAKTRRRALMFYGLSLFVNFSWCFIFFSFRAFGFAFLWLLLLLVLILKTIFEYRKINPRAAYLQIPYALWVCFAGYLCFSVWTLN